MGKLTFRQIVMLCIALMCGLIVIRCWDDIAGFIAIVFTAIIPLILGACIAYIIAIPTNFLERHVLANTKNKFLQDIRKSLCLVITVLLVVVALFFVTSTFIPALKETIVMVQLNGRRFVEGLVQQPLFEPVRTPVLDFLNGDLVTAFESLDFSGMFQSIMGGSVGSVGTQLFSVVSMVMTGFFGLLFSFVLLTDTTGAMPKFVRIAASYLGPTRAARVRRVTSITDQTFHNFIVRQCLEAIILAVVSVVVLLIAQYPYALGIGALLGLAALIPIVGYPIGLLLGAFMVVITSPWTAFAFVLAVAVAQVLEATFVLPHVGDPKTVLPPVWVTVGVTIGGGVAGFLGMLVAIPIASTIRQLVIYDYERRERKKKDRQDEAAAEQEEALVLQGAHARKTDLPEGLEQDDGDSVREVQ